MKTKTVVITGCTRGLGRAMIPVFMMRHLLPAMLERGSGVVVNFSSGWGRSTSAGVAPYCATKYAIEGLHVQLLPDHPEERRGHRAYRSGACRRVPDLGA